MTGKYFLSEQLFHRHIRRFEHVALSPPARAWQCNISLRLGVGMETSAALWAGTGAACRGSCVHRREQNEAGARRVEWLCRMQSWKLPETITAAAMQHRLQGGGRASAATGGKNLHLPHFGVNKTVHEVKIHCVFVAIAKKKPGVCMKSKSRHSRR